jgi:hypothetical protein
MRIPGSSERTALADAERGEHALEQRVDRGDEQLRARLAGLQLVQRREAPRADRKRRARPVVGQTVPRGKLDHLQLGREPAGGIGHCAHRLLVGRDEHRAAAPVYLARGACEVRHDQRLRAAGDRG